MANIYDYINKYGDITFNEKKFNDLDNIIFSFLNYLNYKDVNNKTLKEVGTIYLQNNKIRDIKKYGSSEKEAYKILKEVYNKKRYMNIVLEDYIYNVNGMQFSALTFNINNKLKYISFEGTNHLIKGWEESFLLMSGITVPSHYEAIKYLNKHIKIFGPKIILGGHSKGGNLALISGLKINLFKQLKIKKIYNNDGPGLNKKDYKTIKYKIIKHKIKTIVPKNSIFGIILKSDKKTVVKTSSIPFFSHTMSTWLISDDKLATTNLVKKHEKLMLKIEKWSKKYNEVQKEKMILDIFKILEKNEINDTMSLKKINSIIKIIKDMKNVDEETKELASDFLKILI